MVNYFDSGSDKLHNRKDSSLVTQETVHNGKDTSLVIQEIVHNGKTLHW